jgi:hypothetical protein
VPFATVSGGTWSDAGACSAMAFASAAPGIWNVDVSSEESESSTGYAARSSVDPDGYAPDGKGDGNACEYPASTG